MGVGNPQDLSIVFGSALVVCFGGFAVGLLARFHGARLPARFDGVPSIHQQPQQHLWHHNSLDAYLRTRSSDRNNNNHNYDHMNHGHLHDTPRSYAGYLASTICTCATTNAS
ncbi:hypothetical protein D6D18_02008 [Aureobasidium pullulans]|nr:hypothetical protein D6D18_02008 [Aureobasidium pullulans]